MFYNRCTGIYKFGNNTYPRRIRRSSNLDHIFREKKCVLWAGKYGNTARLKSKLIPYIGGLTARLKSVLIPRVGSNIAHPNSELNLTQVRPKTHFH